MFIVTKRTHAPISTTLSYYRHYWVCSVMIWFTFSTVDPMEKGPPFLYRATYLLLGLASFLWCYFLLIETNWQTLYQTSVFDQFRISPRIHHSGLKKPHDINGYDTSLFWSMDWIIVVLTFVLLGVVQLVLRYVFKWQCWWAQRTDVVNGRFCWTVYSSEISFQIIMNSFV